MKRFIPYIAVACLTGFTASTSFPVIAGGCNSHMNKKAEIICSEEDVKCQTERAKKSELTKTVKS